MFFLSVDFKVVSGWVGQNKFSCQCAVVSRLEFGLDPVTEAEHALPCPALPCSLHVKVHVVTSCIHVHSGRYAHSLDSSLETGKSGKIPKYISIKVPYRTS